MTDIITAISVAPTNVSKWIARLCSTAAIRALISDMPTIFDLRCWSPSPFSSIETRASIFALLTTMVSSPNSIVLRRSVQASIAALHISADDVTDMPCSSSTMNPSNVAMSSRSATRSGSVSASSASSASLAGIYLERRPCKNLGASAPFSEGPP